MKRIIAAAFALTLSLGALACDEQGRTGIVEENSLKVPVGAKSANSLTEAKFNAVIDKVEKIYKPIVKAKGGNLVVQRKWTDSTVNAYAQRSGTTWSVSMFGGLARHATVTEDGFALVVCHELGHHIGGAPIKTGTWAANEGQADFFGSMKCLKRVFLQEDNTAVVAGMKVPEIVVQACESQFKNAEEIAICERSALAGQSLANLFQVLSNLPKAPDFATPDQTRVTTTNHSHPKSQCRMDTYYAGSLCDKDYLDDVSNSDENMGVCTTANGDKVGTRPLCWFKPKA